MPGESWKPWIANWRHFLNIFHVTIFWGEIGTINCHLYCETMAPQNLYNFIPKTNWIKLSIKKLKQKMSPKMYLFSLIGIMHSSTNNISISNCKKLNVPNKIINWVSWQSITYYKIGAPVISLFGGSDHVVTMDTD